MHCLPLVRAAATIAGVAVLIFTVPRTAASSALPLDSAERLFNALSARLLQEQLGMSLTNVQVGPTNQYTAPVHRVFQVAANICEAMNTNAFPLVFRPRFAARSGGLYLDGFTNNNNTTTLGTWLAANTNCIPVVIGARRGLPNFNEYTFRTDMLVTRKLQLRRPDTNSLPSQTNQMYMVSLSNRVGVEAWNSYQTTFTQSSVIEVTNTVTIFFTNSSGRFQTIPMTYVLGASTNIGTWNGKWSQPERGFSLPLITNVVVMSNAVYVYQNDRFEQIGTNLYEDSSTLLDPFYYPAWNLTISNHLVYIHRVETNLLDFVVLRDNTAIALSNLLMNAPSPNTHLGSVWSPAKLPSGLPRGISGQIMYSSAAGFAGEWQQYSAFVGDRNRAAAKFYDFMVGEPSAPTTIETPFNPIARFVRIATWQANDPLIHYHVGDLTAYHSNTNVQAVKWAEQNLNYDPSSLTNINKAYAPWGSVGSLRSGGDPNNFNFMARDPGVTESDLWSFPTNESPSGVWLGRVHRGTPWQTIYLKAGSVSQSEWHSQVGYPLYTLPTNDWRLAATLAAEWNTNAWSDRFSINDADVEHWRELMDGLTVLTNTVDDQAIGSVPGVGFACITITSNSPGVDVVVAAISRMRAMQRRGYFEDVAGWLATPELSSFSPWLNLSSAQRSFGLTDEAYEALPAQLLSRVRADAIAEVAAAGGMLKVRFSGCEPGVYDVETSSNLNTWTKVGVSQQVTGRTFTVEFPLGTEAQFVRAVRQRD